MWNRTDLFKTSSFVYMSLPQRGLLKINRACPVCLHHRRAIQHRLERSSLGELFQRTLSIYSANIYQARWEEGGHSREREQFEQS